MSLTAMFLSMLVVIVSAAIAGFEGNFSSNQMRQRGLGRGFPFVRHTAMWSNLLIVSPALGIMCVYADQWSSGDIVNMLWIAAVVSIALHVVWSAMTDVQEHILGPRMTFTASGLVHAFYLTGALAIVLLFYRHTENVLPQHAALVLILLMVHLPLGNAVVGWAKSGKFDIPGVAGTGVLILVLLIAHFAAFG